MLPRLCADWWDLENCEKVLLIILLIRPLQIAWCGKAAGKFVRACAKVSKSRS
jgi:hypothetical protein